MRQPVDSGRDREGFGVRRTSIFGLPKGSINLLDGLLPLGTITYGGLHFFRPDEVSHADEARHVHTGHCEIFVNVQGRGVVEVEGVDHEFSVGDVFLIEPGESHHVKTDAMDPLVNLFLGAQLKGEMGKGDA